MARRSSATRLYRYDIVLPSSTASASLARTQLIGFLQHLRIAPELVDDISIAAGEALANAAEHGRRPAGTIRVQARVTAIGIEISVSDDGLGFQIVPDEISVPSPLSLRGYGIGLMRAVTDELEFRNQGRTVWFLKRFAEAEAEAVPELGTRAEDVGT